jgi:predicted O-methyltransferase YrrM
MSDIVNDPDKYFRQFIPDRDSLLITLEEEARDQDIPIVGPVVGELLFVLARISKAKRILELGTATGYSAIYLARACTIFDGKVVTLENDTQMAARAMKNIQQAGLENYIEIRIGDALAEIEKSDQIFDLIFIDIEKEDYIRTLPHCERLLKPGGLLVADNIGFKDADAFNHAIVANPKWRPVSVFAFLPYHSPEHDGVCLALRQLDNSAGECQS